MLSLSKIIFHYLFIDKILNRVVGHEWYSFSDGFSGYNQVQIAKEDQLKTISMTDWDTFCTYSKHKGHLKQLDKCLDQFDQYGVSLNSDKCVFGVPSGKLLGNIDSKQGISTDPEKMKKIVNLLRPNTILGIQRFVGHVSYYRRKICSIFCSNLSIT